MSGTSYADLVGQAKKAQQDNLQTSKENSKQLNKTLRALITANSSTSLPLSAIDKITTVHQLNDSIEKQLTNDIARSFSKLKKANLELESTKDKGAGKLQFQFDEHSSGSQAVVDSMFRRAEIADKELRILEQTAKNINDQM